MASVIINIGSPILGAGDSFSVRSRILPDGSFSAGTSYTTNSFTLTGLLDGTGYEIEVTYVKADGTICESVLYQFSTANAFSCIDFAASIQKAGTGYIVHVTYSLPPGFTDPPCGWDFVYTLNGVDTPIHYATLPNTGVINISLPSNSSIVFKVVANLCNGKTTNCYVGDLSKINDPCVPPKVKQTDLVYSNYPTIAYNIRVIFDTTVIPSGGSGNYTVNYYETSPNLGGKPPDSGSKVLSFSSAVNIPVKPNGTTNCLRYRGSVQDNCGNTYAFCVFYPNNPDLCGCGS